MGALKGGYGNQLDHDPALKEKYTGEASNRVLKIVLVQALTDASWFILHICDTFVCR